MGKPAFFLGLIAVISGLAVSLAVPPAAAKPPALATEALEVLCAATEEPDLIEIAGTLGVFPLAEERLEAVGQRAGWRGSFSTLEGGELYLTVSAPGGAVRRLTIEIWERTVGGARPWFILQAARDCRPQLAREITYRVDGARDRLVHYDSDLNPMNLVEPLNPITAPAPDRGLRRRRSLAL